MPTFASWESEVLELAYDAVDYISAHAYYEPIDGDIDSFLASAVDMDHFVHSIVSAADTVAAKLKSKKKIQISFDEWNVWYQSRYDAAQETEWQVAPRVIEDHYNVADAVVVGSLLISLLRHSDRVTAACQAQLVNVIAPILTEPGGPRGGRRSSTRSRSPPGWPRVTCCEWSRSRRPTKLRASATYQFSTPCPHTMQKPAPSVCSQSTAAPPSR